MAAQYWMVALPQKADIGVGLDSLRSCLGTNGMGKVLPFDTPSMAIGTLDSLMALTDDLVKINLQVEVQNASFFRERLNAKFIWRSYSTVLSSPTKPSPFLSNLFQSYLPPIIIIGTEGEN